MKTKKLSPIWGTRNSVADSRGMEAEEADIPPIDLSRAFVHPQQKYQEAVKELDCLITQYLGEEDPREMVKLGDKLHLHNRYLKTRRRLISPAYVEIDSDHQDDFPSGTIYGPEKRIDSIIVKQLRNFFGGLALDKQIAWLDLLMEREIKQATTTDDQAYFLVFTRRICIIAELIDMLLKRPRLN